MIIFIVTIVILIFIAITHVGNVYSPEMMLLLLWLIGIAGGRDAVSADVAGGFVTVDLRMYSGDVLFLVILMTDVCHFVPLLVVDAAAAGAVIRLIYDEIVLRVV